MLSRTAQYALCAMVYSAQYGDEPRTAQQMAEGTGAPRAYLATVLKALSRRGLLDSRPGRDGGYTLARDPSEITLLDVVDAVDPLPPIDVCPLKHAEHEQQLCPVHRRLAKITAFAERVLNDCTIADLLA